MIEFPVLNVKMISSNRVKSNDYNPNKVAPKELELLRISIEEDGVTQPIVTFYDKENDEYIIVDGFHRYKVLVDILKQEEIPIVVIDKNISERRASTIRHNRARGKHFVEPMADIVKKLVNEGWNNNDICKYIGMSSEELLRMKQINGIAKFLSSKDYSNAWEFE